MSKRKKREEEESSGGAPKWMTTFSDLMSLLLCFFVLLFSMSSVSEEKFKAAAESMQSALMSGKGNGIMENHVPTSSGEEVQENPGIPEGVLEMYEDVQAFVDANDMGSVISLSRDSEGIYVDIQDSILFDSGKAVVASEGNETLTLIGELINQFDNRVIVEGHTDNVPSNLSEFPSNWELSSGRANAVLRYLVEKEGVNATRMSATGYGEYQPIKPNDTSENKARNRRVNIVLVHEKKPDVSLEKERE